MGGFKGIVMKWKDVVEDLIEGFEECAYDVTDSTDK